MRCKFRIALAIGCAGLLASSIPAFSRPLPRPVAVSRPLLGSPALVSEARKYLGTNPTARRRLWCATFMNFVLAKAGYTGTNSDAAKSFAYYGRRISEPKVGAIAVLTRGKRGGHVGVVSGVDTHGNPIIISGNHGHRVGEATYPRARVIAYVMPTDHRSLPRFASRAPASQPPSPGPGLDSPIAELLAAINAEQERSRLRSQARAQPVVPARPPEPVRPPVPHRTVQQLPDQRVRDVVPSPRPAPPRQQRVEQPQREHVALATPTDRR